MSVRTGGIEWGILTVRGYNLMEFSVWGCVPIFAVLLAPVILFGSQSNDWKELELIFLFSAHLVCYVHSFNAAKVWMHAVGDSMLSLRIGALLYPSGIVILFLVIKFLDFIAKRKKCCKQYRMLES